MTEPTPERIAELRAMIESARTKIDAAFLAEILPALPSLLDAVEERDRLLATLTGAEHDLASAIKIITEHVPSDALGANSDGGGDGWNDRSWPILDEYLYNLNEGLAAIRAALGDKP